MVRLHDLCTCEGLRVQQLLGRITLYGQVIVNAVSFSSTLPLHFGLPALKPSPSMVPRPQVVPRSGMVSLFLH